MPARSPTAGRLRLIAVATSSRHLADGDERLTDPPREQPLQPEQRHQRLVPAQRASGNEPAAQHAARDPPPRDTGEVEILDMAQAKARCTAPSTKRWDTSAGMSRPSCTALAAT